jgi:hypothetical protein
VNVFSERLLTAGQVLDLIGPSHVPEINHYLYQGQRDWGQPFKALFMGGGSGEAALMLATQLEASQEIHSK